MQSACINKEINVTLSIIGECYKCVNIYPVSFRVTMIAYYSNTCQDESNHLKRITYVRRLLVPYCHFHRRAQGSSRRTPVECVPNTTHFSAGSTEANAYVLSLRNQHVETAMI